MGETREVIERSMQKQYIPKILQALSEKIVPYRQYEGVKTRYLTSAEAIKILQQCESEIDHFAETIPIDFNDVSAHYCEKTKHYS
jgi:hypothetical protein